MIATVVETALRRLRHGRTELMLTFVVPVVFFTIFAMIFGSGVGRNPRVRTLIADADGSERSAALVAAIEEQAGVVPTVLSGSEDPAAEAERQVREGRVSAAVVIPKGWGATPGVPPQAAGGFAERRPAGLPESSGDRTPKDSGGAADDASRGTTSSGGDAPGVVRVLSDSSNQVGAQVVGALVQKALFESMRPTPGVPPQGAGGSSPMPPAGLPESLRGRTPGDSGGVADDAASGTTSSRGDAPGVGLPPVEVVDLLGEGKSNPLVAMSAAGIAVMFLLFSAAGSGGSILEEEETGTLERLLCSNLSMTQLLLGKWLFITAQGVLQVTAMFLWGQWVFGVDLLGHLPGFASMTLATAAAASSFALLLATACRSRTQLNGVSTILILTMSALGGSMVPRYVMSESMQEWGLFTFNAWALDGYNKVFWRDMPVESLTPQLGVLCAAAVGLLVLARILAGRWERA